MEQLYRLVMGNGTACPGGNVACAIWDLTESERVNVLCALSNILTLPYSAVQSVEQQGWEERSEKHLKLIEAVIAPYCGLSLAMDPSPQV